MLEQGKEHLGNEQPEYWEDRSLDDGDKDTDVGVDDRLSVGFEPSEKAFDLNLLLNCDFILLLSLVSLVAQLFHLFLLRSELMLLGVMLLMLGLLGVLPLGFRTRRREDKVFNLVESGRVCLLLPNFACDIGSRCLDVIVVDLRNLFQRLTLGLIRLRISVVLSFLLLFNEIRINTRRIVS